MGCDGGTIPKRDELVQTKKRPEQKDKDSVRAFRWQHCFISQQRLAKPIVACELGHLYNKEAVIEKLLNDRSSGVVVDDAAGSSSIRHIRNLKDVKELVLEDNPAYDDSSAAGPSVGDGGYVDRLTAPYVCPFTSLEMNGKFKFVLDWSNGRVMSERASKMLKDDETSCIAEADLVILNPDEDSPDFDSMMTRMEARRARAKVAKKAASKRKTGDPEVASTSNGAAAKKVKSDGKGQPDLRPESGGKVNNGKEPSKRPSTVQGDPTKSEVFKSLFSSHKSAANKVKGHWVTFDPRYN